MSVKMDQMRLVDQGQTGPKKPSNKEEKRHSCACRGRGMTGTRAWHAWHGQAPLVPHWVDAKHWAAAAASGPPASMQPDKRLAHKLVQLRHHLCRGQLLPMLLQEHAQHSCCHTSWRRTNTTPCTRHLPSRTVKAAADTQGGQSNRAGQPCCCGAACIHTGRKQPCNATTSPALQQEHCGCVRTCKHAF